ncbi:uncharacterized protein B0I36DRAFT_366680 [Microdochium trichocladiopsis]|uniref:Uncharacterized protein n=1 Tax=Microdochium trichocladiopsis TaxID=1682393 RepID=A0A9P8XZ72_9PEZI|nr:uncharacterized protein B0I36DRAFT_366680 [Microdochium trichocladiopsis]KAH7024765.1 hypothetical protein B0I36DRAFT_366680 [Microdochium trichocladiopsis]
MDSTVPSSNWLFNAGWLGVTAVALIQIHKLYPWFAWPNSWTGQRPSVKPTASNTQPAQDPDWDTLDFSKTEPIAANYDWSGVEEKPYRPWHDGPYRVTMGIQKTQLDDWVEIDKQYLERYKYKRDLYAKHPDDTICFRPDSHEAAFEALAYLADFLPRRYPSMFVKTANGISNLVTGDDWDLRRDADTWKSHHPLQVMGLLSTEDWFIMQTDEDQETMRLVAGANCFPAGWRLRQRIGLSLWQIHVGNVPQYEEKLSKSMDRFFLRLRADRPFMRFNYAIDISGELFHINSHHNLTADMLEKPVLLEDLHLRVERQCLQRLPRSRAIAFSIRTYVTPITEVTKDKNVARALRTSVASYTPEIAEYKNKHLWNDVLTKHLEDVLKTDGAGDEEIEHGV